MNQVELNEILEKHKKWLDGDEGGEKAELRGADLRWANLQEAEIKAEETCAKEVK